MQLVLKSVLTKHEREKKREYKERIMNIEHGTFTPLIFTIHGGMGPECAAYHQNLAGEQYAKVLTFIMFDFIQEGSQYCS